MPQLTVQQFTIKKDEAGNPKKDNYGNTQMMIKFAESPETVYKAVKDPATVTEGKVMYGEVVEGPYGFKFKADPFNQGGGDVGGTPPQGTGQAPQIFNRVNDHIGDNEIKEILLDMYEKLVGNPYGKVAEDTTSTPEALTEPVEVSDDELNEELGF